MAYTATLEGERRQCASAAIASAGIIRSVQFGRERSIQMIMLISAIAQRACSVITQASISAQQLAPQRIAKKKPYRTQPRSALQPTGGINGSRWQRIRVRRLTGENCQAAAMIKLAISKGDVKRTGVDDFNISETVPSNNHGNP
jgi:hypothetical protein